MKLEIFEMLFGSLFGQPQKLFLTFRDSSNTLLKYRTEHDTMLIVQALSQSFKAETPANTVYAPNALVRKIFRWILLYITEDPGKLIFQENINYSFF